MWSTANLGALLDASHLHGPSTASRWPGLPVGSSHLSALFVKHAERGVERGLGLALPEGRLPVIKTSRITVTEAPGLWPCPLLPSGISCPDSPDLFMHPAPSEKLHPLALEALCTGVRGGCRPTLLSGGPSSPLPDWLGDPEPPGPCVAANACRTRAERPKGGPGVEDVALEASTAVWACHLQTLAAGGPGSPWGCGRPERAPRALWLWPRLAAGSGAAGAGPSRGESAAPAHTPPAASVRSLPRPVLGPITASHRACWVAPAPSLSSRGPVPQGPPCMPVGPILAASGAPVARVGAGPLGQHHGAAWALVCVAGFRGTCSTSLCRGGSPTCPITPSWRWCLHPAAARGPGTR